MSDQAMELLRELSDSPDEFELNQSIAVFRHHGEDIVLELRSRPRVGTSVLTEKGQSVPLDRYVQEKLLRLPKLAAQITRALDFAQSERPTPYIEGEAELIEGKSTLRWTQARPKFLEFVEDAEYGSTRLITLMADAGQGKTVLLEKIALDAAANYFADAHPRPLILPVDLLGRYVGTIDDAIAGSLNNTYLFPGLTQKDVAVCVRNSWLVLALDGFDELVARIGARDSFLRINELVDQLKGAGTVILSARKSFFEMQEVSSALRAYLRPRTGSYTAPTVTLVPWGRAESMSVLRSLGSPNPERDADQLFSIFAEDQQLLSEPFFLTRVAKMWLDGGDLALPGGGDHLARAEYLIGEFTKRETEEKWAAREGGAPLLSKAHHKMLLGVIAQEMWISAAFRLTVEELRIAVEIALATSTISPEVIAQVKERTPTHGALRTSGKFTQFKHQRFFNYFLAARIVDLMKSPGSNPEFVQILNGPEFGPEILEWIEWLASKAAHAADRVNELAVLGRTGSSENAKNNASNLLSIVLSGQSQEREIAGVAFTGDAFKSKQLKNVTFKDCRFWHVDLSGAVFEDCVFDGANFGDVRLGADTKFSGSSFLDVIVQSVVINGPEGEKQSYSPQQIAALLSDMGALCVNPAEEPATEPIDQEAIKTVEKLVKLSTRLWDMAREEFEEEHEAWGRTVIREGLRCGVLKEVAKATSGPKKHFVRLQVDRDDLANGWRQASKNQAIRSFWDELRKQSILD